MQCKCFQSGVPLPIEWDMHPKDGSGKEKEVHLVPLDPNANEYKKVADEVRKTSTVAIIKIERVQTPGLYRSYMVKKEQMEHKNGSNEKTLFHGTAGDSCPTINKFGFNRSYCGKNGKFLSATRIFEFSNFSSPGLFYNADITDHLKLFYSLAILRYCSDKNIYISDIQMFYLNFCAKFSEKPSLVIPS